MCVYRMVTVTAENCWTVVTMSTPRFTRREANVCRSVCQPPLPSNESEVAAEFQEKVFQPVDQRFFHSAFGIFVVQSKELENQGVLDPLFRGQLLGRLRRLTSAENCRLVA